MSDVPAGTGVRSTACALIFLTTTIDYLDRQVLGILVPKLARLGRWAFG